MVDFVAKTVEDVRRELGDEGLARVTARLRPWQEALERDWAALPARLAGAPVGRGIGEVVARWIAERESAVRATQAVTPEDRALAGLELATLEDLRARFRAADEPEPTPPAARYELALEGTEAPVSSLAPILDLWLSVVARAAREDATLERYSAPRLVRERAGMSLVFEGTDAMVQELRGLLERLGSRGA